MAKHFNTAGPCQSDIHYILPPTARLPDLKALIHGRNYLEGDVPAVVMEFLSDKEGGEYSFKRTYPPGKWFFYEQILQVPVYIIFDPDGGLIEYYELKNERYELKQPDENGRHWIESMELFLGTWQGTKEGRTGYWLRWWEQTGNLLPWALELIEQERQQVEQERQRAEREHQRAEREHQRAEQERQEKEMLIAYLRSQGIDPNNLPNHAE
ncbi:Uma2 family endonuclease [Cylindrospermopsis raciborskii]|uniref:Uma2 family endonuclease n=1 Tax=Cylindrospermopsis raciborskii TaxID=77022 RepID=UPI000A79143F|nr:Uma2 family endonuclease [Cylindrospermopsis raciborskii]